MRFPAVVTAGDRGAAKAVYGQSKGYLEIAGRPLVAHVVAVLQRVPEVSEVWVVGDEERLRAVFGSREPAPRAAQAAPPDAAAQQSLRERLGGLPAPAAGGGRERARPRARGPRHRGALPLGRSSVRDTAGDLGLRAPGEPARLQLRARARDRGLDGGFPARARRASPASAWRASICARAASVRAICIWCGRRGSSTATTSRRCIATASSASSAASWRWRGVCSRANAAGCACSTTTCSCTSRASPIGAVSRALADALRRFAPLARIEACCSDLLRASVRFVVTQARRHRHRHRQRARLRRREAPLRGVEQGAGEPRRAAVRRRRRSGPAIRERSGS